MLAQLAAGLERSGDLRADVSRFLGQHGCPRTAEHCLRVAEAARRLAQRFDADPAQAEQAGWLHDVSAVIPTPQRLAAAMALGVEVLPEEAAFPKILHQKLSVEFARAIFEVEDPAILSAIGCHTTLKANSSRLDQVVFLADKLEWDQAGTAPYSSAVRAGLDRSLEHGAYAYLDYLWQQREALSCVHPWLIAAYHQLEKIIAR